MESLDSLNFQVQIKTYFILTYSLLQNKKFNKVILE